jgi:hypothetical protein
MSSGRFGKTSIPVKVPPVDADLVVATPAERERVDAELQSIKDKVK